ncbi:MAG: MBL fold metallo-hydrolase [bacterium]|nr:MBL fold metallo-hydrolase [bacterium]
MFERLSDNLYLFRDVCNVYVLKDGNRALLVDFGRGEVLARLGEIGVGKVDWILHTHHHRDQCQGDRLANARGIPIAVPAYERPYFDEVEVFWGSRQVYNLYDTRHTFSTLAESVAVARSLLDYETFEWGPYRLFIQPTPGHSMGHVALLGEVDGRRVAFSGDLIAAPGKVESLYGLQYYYGDSDGMDYLIYSLAKMRGRGVALACPSHGAPFGEVDDALRALETKVRDWRSHRYFHLGPPTPDIAPRAVLPHLIHIPGCSNTFVVIADNGNALFVDYGAQGGNFLSSNKVHFEANNRLRMLEHNLDLLRERFGLKTIDVAIPSHYHDDHVNGLPYLQRHHGTQIWCYKNMTDILQNPHGYKLGCVFAQPVRVDRSLDQGETFRWEGYEFQVFHAPGHADYHMAMFGEIDGTRVAFSGDNFFSGPGGRLYGNNIWRNHVHANSFEITGRLFLERQPELTCPGHGEPLRLGGPAWRDFNDWCREEQEHWRGLAVDGHAERAVYPDYVFLYPYQPPCAPGQSVRMEVWFENIFDKPATLEYALNLPQGWRAEPERGKLTAAPGKKTVAPFRLTVPAGEQTAYRRRVFTLDAVIDGQPLGQIAEALVDLRPQADWR